MKIAYLTMAYDLEKTYSIAIPNCVDQSGDFDKVLYLMYQEPFPPHIGINHDLPIQIKEYNVKHIKGSGWWLMKLNRFLDVCQQRDVVWWDEDDYRLHDYTELALAAISDKNPVAWDMWNYEVKRGSIFRRKYTSGMGTLVARVEALKSPARKITSKWPCGRIRKDHKGNLVDSRYSGRFTYGGGALDAHMKRLLKKQYDVQNHDGVRHMVFHSKTNTRGGRKPEENVNYA